MYDLDRPEEQALAGRMAMAFEQALGDRLRALPSHAELAAFATRAGHRTRPVACLLACDAAGGSWHEALTASVAIEFVHKASVIRDDVADGDDMRSGQPAVHARFGVDKALALSDLLWLEGVHQVGSGLPDDIAGRCFTTLLRTVREMALGQLEDVAPTPTPTPTLGSIARRLAVDEQKTGSLSGCACAVGAIVADAPEQHVAALERYGRKVGTAFQLLNDLRNLNGNEEARDAHSDVRLRRETVLSAYARANSSGASRQLLEEVWPQARELNVVETTRIRDAIAASGAAAFAEKMADDLLAEARTELRALPETPAKAVLEALTGRALRSYAF